MTELGQFPMSADTSRMAARIVDQLELIQIQIEHDVSRTGLESQLGRYDIEPRQICFEITETTAVHNLTHVAGWVKRLRKTGARFALDDFGSGMSSFGYLRQLPVDMLKIDGMFIMGLLEDPVNCAMIEAVTRVAAVMDINTVAEAVESRAAADRLVQLGVVYAQGNAIHEPEPL